MVIQCTMTHAELLSILHYDPETGVFTRLDGRPIRDLKFDGVRKRLSVPGMKDVQLAHRLAAFYMTGEWPEQVDHINHDPSDNRWCNLRPCTHLENQQNKRVYKTNKLGMKNIVFNGHSDPKWQRWTVKVTINGESVIVRCKSLETALETRALLVSKMQPFAQTR